MHNLDDGRRGISEDAAQLLQGSEARRRLAGSSERRRSSTRRSSTSSDRGAISAGARVPWPAEAARVWAWPVRLCGRCGQLFFRGRRGRRLRFVSATSSARWDHQNLFLFFSFLWLPFLKCRVSNLQISSIMDDKLHSCSKEVLYMTLTSQD